MSAWIREKVSPVAVGDWSFELRDDDLSRIRYRGHDALRSVRAVVRDRDWATAVWGAPEVAVSGDEATIRLASTSFEASLSATLSVRARGPELEVSLEASAASLFLTNRTGLVVLHPPTLAGSALEVAHTDGSVSRTAFPRDIAPHQPAFDIAGLAWEHDGVEVSLRFAGDSFEMEDQRNWTDASFKTYSRPLALPFPYEMPAVVRQTVTITAAETLPITRDRPGTPELLRVPTGPQGLGPVPVIAVGASTAPSPAPGDDAPRALGGERLVELDLGWAGWPAALARAAASGLPLDVRLTLPEADPESAVARAVASFEDVPLARVAAFRPAGHEAEHVSDAGAILLLRDALAGRDVPVIGGARSHFTELNREQHRLPEGLDGVAFSTTPLFHALETLQLEEAVAMQRLVAEQAVRIAGGIPVHVGPVTLRTHVNNVATTAPPRPRSTDLTGGYGPELLDADDDRQGAEELASWTIASAAALAVPGVATISFFEEWGPRGVRTASGEDLPVAAAVRELAALAGGDLVTAASADGRVWAIGSAGRAILVANMDETERPVEIGGSEHPLPPRTWRRFDT